MKNNYTIMDKKENKRTNEVLKRFCSDEVISENEIFNSKEIPKIFEQGSRAHWHSFSDGNLALPLNCLLFDKTIVEICSCCHCNLEPEIIRPYLERGLVLPILTEPYRFYKPNLLNEIIKYPHIGYHTSMLYRIIKTIQERFADGICCPNCFEEDCKKLIDDISKSPLNGNQKYLASSLLTNVVLPQLQPPRNQDKIIFDQLKTYVKEGKFESIMNLGKEANLVNGLRVSEMFSAIPQIDQYQLDGTVKILSNFGISLPENYNDEISKKEWLLNALNLEYNPKIPIDEYLDIIMPRKQKINSLLNQVVNSQKDTQTLNDEIWKINQEISSSKSLETVTFLTNFLSKNAAVISGMLSGVVIGSLTGDFLSCGLAGIGGTITGLVGKLASNHKPLNIPKPPKKTIEWVKSRIEQPEYKALSTILAKDNKIVQIWALKEKLK